MGKDPRDQYSDKEAKKRFESALRGAFKTQPKPLKDVPKKREPAQSKKGSSK
jgi:hypothetical protein